MGSSFPALQPRGETCHCCWRKAVCVQVLGAGRGCPGRGVGSPVATLQDFYLVCGGCYMWDAPWPGTTRPLLLLCPHSPPRSPNQLASGSFSAHRAPRILSTEGLQRGLPWPHGHPLSLLTHVKVTVPCLFPVLHFSKSRITKSLVYLRLSHHCPGAPRGWDSVGLCRLCAAARHLINC